MVRKDVEVVLESNHLQNNLVIICYFVILPLRLCYLL